MTAQLLALSIGPVQEFIAAARRTRDLWFGSYLLSEISKAAARAVEVAGGKLIFPAPRAAADLEAGSPFNVANIILAECNGCDPATVARAAKEAARGRWGTFAEEVFRAQQSSIDADIWRDQVDDVIEFFAAWHTYSPGTYGDDRAQLMRLLAARKRCRDFARARGRPGIPKSSLDGLRESVLGRPRERPMDSRRALRLSNGEQLDVVGMVKRAWAPDGDSLSYPSVARIAADPWIRRLKAKEIDLTRLKAACRTLRRKGVHEFATSGSRLYPPYSDFPFEGTVLFRSRHRSLREEAEIDEDDPEFAELVEALAEVAKAARDKEIPAEPDPYLGVLIADGDRMGEAIAMLNSPDEHRSFSQALAGFAAEARKIVEGHHGTLVYAGGDDVLAFVPVDGCLGCARELHDRFEAMLKGWFEATLSVGLAVAHFMEPLEDLRNYAREAEQHAKGARTERNGLAVHVVKRGGGPLSVRGNWPEGPDLHLCQLVEWVGAGSISGRIAYEMHEIAAVYDNWTGEQAEPMRGGVLSVLEGKRPRGASAIPEIANMVRERVKDAGSLRALEIELLIARAIAGMSAGTGVA